MPIEIAVEKFPNLQLMTLRGRLDSAGTPDFQNSMNAVIESGEKCVLIDCAELRYISSVGLGAFVASSKTLVASGGGLFFAGLTQHVRSVFEMVGFFGIFEVYPSVQDALESPRLRGLDTPA
jgi:anti-sigma B factor antagonist